MTKTVMTDTMLWLNGTWAGLLLENGEDIFKYGKSARKMPLKLFHKAIEKFALKEWWGITDQTTLLHQIQDKSTTDGGHHVSFDSALRITDLWHLTEGDFHKKLAEASSLSEKDRSELCTIRKMMQKKKLDTIIAWDYSRAIMLCVRGYGCGYISFDQSLDMAIEIGKKLQACFDSWEEMNESYLTGYEYWLGLNEDVDQQLSERIKFIDKVKALENGPYSLPWNMELRR